MDKLLKIIDAEENMEYQIKVTEQEYDRAITDLEYATTLLQDAKHAAENSETSSITESEKQEEQESNGEEENVEKDRAATQNIWTESSTKLFITIYKEYEQQLAVGQTTHKIVWQKISNKMKSYGYNVSSKQCCTKLASLKRMYKSIKDYNNKTGNNRKTWLYFNALDEIFSNKPWVAPLSTISSSNDNMTTTAIEALEKSQSYNGTISKKRKVDNVITHMLAMKEAEHAEKKIQHQQKMQRLDKMNNLLERLAAAVENKDSRTTNTNSNCGL